MPKKPSSASDLPPLILVHGFRGAPVGLKAIADDLERAGYTVFTPPIPPFAGATKLEKYTPKAYADYLADFVKSNHLAKPILIGHSMGSVVVASALAHHPEFFAARSILMSPISKRPPLPIRLISPLSAFLPRPVADYLSTRYLFIPHDRVLFQQTLNLTHVCSNDHPPSSSEMCAASKFSINYDLSDFTLTQDLLFLAGNQDRLVSRHATTKLAQVTNSQITFLPDSGHLHNYEKPHETAQAIIKFLTQK